MIEWQVASTKKRHAEGNGTSREDGGRSDPESIVLRRVNIDFDLPPDRPWISDGNVIERMLSAFSFMLPPGENFFIESVRAYAGDVSDPVLKEQMRRFIYQEAMHGQQHDAANRLLQQHYTRGTSFEKLTRRHLAFWAFLLPRSGRLAVTCAIEHFTAMAAHTLLRFQIEYEPWVNPALYRLWLWHAVEESEHKSVCFDVYRSCVGTGPLSYLLRCFMYLLTSLLLPATLVIGMRMLGPRPSLPPQPSAPPKLSRRRGLPALLRQFLPWRQCFAYYRPSFHPSDYDCPHYIEQWKARFPDFDGSAPEPRPSP
jgi:predicted metal-dependent hydrolase